MNNQQLDSETSSTGDARFSKLEAHMIGVGALASAIGLDWLFGLQTLDKAAIALYTAAVLIYFAVVGESGTNKSGR